MDPTDKEVIANIRGCLISTKGACDIRQLKKDYMMLMGCEIPYRKFGFKTLEDYLQTIPSLKVIKTDKGYMIDAKPSEKTTHIANMVSRQKTQKKKTRFSTRLLSTASDVNRRPTTRWRPKNLTKKWKTPYTQSTLPVSHNQFVSYTNGKKEPTKTIPPLMSVSTNFNNNKATVINNNVVKEADYSGSTVNKRKLINLGSESSSGSSSRDLSYRNNDVTKELLALSTQTPLKPSNIQIQINTTSDQENIRTFLLQNNTPVESGDSLVDLYAFVVRRNLPDPVFKIVKRKSKSQKNVIYDCKLEMNDRSYTSYPNDFNSDYLAKQFTAKLAMEDLKNEISKEQYMLVSTREDVLERIPPIVEKHFHGIWSWQLEADYIDMFHEQLPTNWLQVVNMSPCISVEPCLEDKFVLRHCKIGEKGKMTTHVPLASELSVPSNTINFNDNTTITAQITCATSAKEIWCRQLGTPEAESYMAMMKNLLIIYTSVAKYEHWKAKNVNVGGFYVALMEDDSFTRVRVLEVFENEVNCFLIDFGDDYLISKENIYEMKREFAKEQAQAFICRLHGLEDLYEVSVWSDCLQGLVGKTVYIERNPEDLAKNESNDPVLSVIMYNLHNKCINQELITQITIESAKPVLQKAHTYVVNVSHVEPNGDVYIQIHSPGYHKLQELLADLDMTVNDPSFNVPKATITKANSTNRLFFAKYKEDGHWYRVRIIDWAPNMLYCQIYFVDYGNTDVINIQKDILYSLDEISDVVAQYPEQAVKVRMDIGKIPVDFVKKVYSIIPSNEEVTLKCINIDANDAYTVEFFKRSQPNNILFAVSQSILLETKLNTSDDGNNNTSNTQSTKLRRLISLNQFEENAQNSKNVPSSGCLKPPPIPKVGEYFDVKIPFAVNPWNFVIQPRSSAKTLADLMIRLQNRYINVLYSPLQIEDIQHGKIYASKHTDGKWYRTSVIKVIHSGSISVFYCDYGYYANLTLQQLIPLDVEFMDFPFQAVKAKLAGIKPKQDKWTMEDCKFFEQLVCRKAFVSIIKKIEKDELYRSDTVLLLELIDTSTEDDINIGSVLIQEQIAIEK